MTDMHPIKILAFALLGAVALASVSYLASAPGALPSDAMAVAAEPVHGSPSNVVPANGGTVAMPNHDPHRISLLQRPTVETAEVVATPNHDPHRVRATPSLVLNPATLRAEPEPAKPAFAAADTTLYARDNARLRAAPDIAADILTKLAADARLRAVARSTDGAWWRVSLADGRIGYVHRTAVTRYRMAKTKPPAPAPVIAAAPPVIVPPSRSQGLLAAVDETMNWLADAAARGSAPAALRTER